jgi:hypothetical protein
MSTPIGIGVAVARAVKGTSFEVRWAPALLVTIDATLTTGITAVEFHPQGENASTMGTIVLVFQSPGTPRTAQVTRGISSTAVNASGDGITGTLTALA